MRYVGGLDRFRFAERRTMMLNCGTAMSGERWGRGGRDAYGVCNKRWITIEGILDRKSPVEQYFRWWSSVDCFGGGVQEWASSGRVMFLLRCFAPVSSLNTAR